MASNYSPVFYFKNWLERRAGLISYLAKYKVKRDLPKLDAKSILLLDAACGELAEQLGVERYIDRASLRLLVVAYHMQDEQGYIHDYDYRVICNSNVRQYSSDFSRLIKMGYLVVSSGRYNNYKAGTTFRFTPEGLAAHHLLISIYGNLCADIQRVAITGK